jgi:hypothetical protein
VGQAGNINMADLTELVTAALQFLAGVPNKNYAPKKMGF